MNSANRQPDPEQISVIVPVKNEEASIRRLLSGLTSQTHLPAEIVITDGGSSDRTREIIREHQSLSPVPIVLIEDEEALPGRGRNLAIAAAKHEWIASIDGGITPRPDWLAQLVAAAKKMPEAEVIYGVAQPLTDTYFVECAAIAYVPQAQLTKVIPSCMLRHSAWLKAGRFREDLRSGEDVLFMRRLDDAGVITTKCETAIVTWELCPTLASTFRRFAVYSRSGMKAGLAGEWQYNVTRLYLLMAALLVAAIWFWPLALVPPLILLVRAEKRIRNWFSFHNPERVWIEMLNPRRILTVAWINVVIDAATFLGMGRWFVSRR
jgi:glycosyltransferase involved in cell wall biosynthesis